MRDNLPNAGHWCRHQIPLQLACDPEGVLQLGISGTHHPLALPLLWLGIFQIYLFVAVWQLQVLVQLGIFWLFSEANVSAKTKKMFQTNLAHSTCVLQRPGVASRLSLYTRETVADFTGRNKSLKKVGPVHSCGNASRYFQQIGTSISQDRLFLKQK